MLPLAGAAFAAEAGGVGLVHRSPAEVAVAVVAPPPLEEHIPVRGPWVLVGAQDGVRAYETRLPIRSRALFFDRPPEGMVLRAGNKVLSYGITIEHRARPGTWEFSTDSLTVRLKPDAPPPDDESFTLAWTDALDRERSLYATEGAGAEFVLRSVQIDDVSRSGALLPAPSRIGWDVEIPAGGVLTLRAGLIPAEVRGDRPSDGADLDLSIDGATVASWRVGSGFATHDVDLGAWAGRTVRLAFSTHDEDPHRDQVFVADPRIYVPKDKPQRVVLAFVDTLRRDHLGSYGYRRESSPFLDAWAAGATVFEDARTIAPWTLPSTRALLSGREPEFWAESPPLQARLGALGWATAAYVGNIYLSANFDMSLAWGEHGCVNWPAAELEVWRTLEFLEDHPDEDAFVMVHFMDLHLPYKEPWAYRKLYVESVPEGLDGMFNRNTLLKTASFNREPIRRYLVDRYDQNLRYVDDQLRHLFTALGDEATLLFFADHGEEFFDHGNLEHGHSLYEELLRVPLMLRHPELPPGRVPGRVSLLDVAPTFTELLGLEPIPTDGRSLVALARGADPSFATRELAFGRTLYNGEAWGSLSGNEKYISNSGREQIFDLAKDPGEAQNLVPKGAPTEAAVEALARALKRPVDLAFRLNPSGRVSKDYTVEMHVPGGIRKAWIGDDPTKITTATLVQVDRETVRLKFESKLEFHREAFVVPERPIQEVVDEVSIRFVSARPPAEAHLADRIYDGSAASLGRLRSDGRSLNVNYAIVPHPVGQATSGADAEMASALEALGYLDPAARGEE